MNRDVLKNFQPESHAEVEKMMEELQKLRESPGKTRQLSAKHSEHKPLPKNMSGAGKVVKGGVAEKDPKTMNKQALLGRKKQSRPNETMQLTHSRVITRLKRSLEGQEEILEHRKKDCSYFNSCLSSAAMRDWNAFSCAACPFFKDKNEANSRQ
jgi:hypothetical protein